MNLSETIVPKSDQLNADDLMSGPVTVTISEVRKGSLEQPVDVIVTEFPGRAYRPSKSMRRVMVMAWGAEASAYVGHQLTLFRNPEIRFGAEKVGGVEIAAMSNIDKPLTVALTAKRGQRKNFTVSVLEPTVQRDWLAELDMAADNLDALETLGKSASRAHANEAVITQIRARYTSVKASAI